MGSAAMKPFAPLRIAFADPNLLGHVLKGDTFRPHRILLMAGFGEALTDDERVIFKQFTDRDREPGECVKEFAVVAGSRLWENNPPTGDGSSGARGEREGDSVGEPDRSHQDAMTMDEVYQAYDLEISQRWRTP
jgi:hypothetical protein